MKLPLFALLRYAKGHPLVPDELRSSPIECLEWLRAESKAGRRHQLYFYQPMRGIDVIESIVERALRSRGPVRLQDAAEIGRRVAARTYDNPSQFSLYLSRHFDNKGSGCFISGDRYEDTEPRLYFSGQRCWTYGKVIPIKPAPTVRCHWCGVVVKAGEDWGKRYRRTQDGDTNKVHCKSRDCRRISWLQHTPKSRGGIELTRQERRGIDCGAWDAQRAINYFNLVTKEIKRNGRNTNHDLRRCAPNDPANHLGPAQRANRSQPRNGYRGQHESAERQHPN